MNTDRVDCVRLSFDPQCGHEQTGRRPAFVLSSKIYNKKAGLALCCPITNQIKGYPFEVVISGTEAVSGAVLTDQIKSLDWQARRAVYICKLSEKVIRDIVNKVQLLISL
ncbi:endoribonuclease MazF [Candidatus Magnetomonas plexicatena]|uniref:endoribonuclease MazF n=1 Tax=Candidatus Magnetomonas plexicatena TaxID=2552947 RepID=UPI001104561C|nr:endoribonuclease MazF [Nitrospirales bacterium LBB_01]